MSQLYAGDIPGLPFRLRLPIFSAPMFLVSGPELVIAASRAGIIGAFPNNNVRTTEEYGAWLEQISTALRRPDGKGYAHAWAANLITHSTNSRLKPDLEHIRKYQPPIVITALGSPKPVVDVVHDYDGLVIADVVNLKLAEKAVQAGIDGLACICAGAGGHTGHLSLFAFVSAVRSFFNGLVVAGGGIADGWGIAGALAAGADMVYLGTRFIPTPESLADERHKQMLIECGPDDLLVSAALTGTIGSWLKPSLVQSGLDPNNMPATPERVHDSARSKDVRRWRDVWSAGQGVGAIKRIEPVGTVVDQLEREFGMALARLAGLSPARAG